MKRLSINPLKPRELDRTVLMIAAWVGAIVIAWVVQPPWPGVLGLILVPYVFSAELLRRHFRDVRRENARQRADRAG